MEDEESVETPEIMWSTYRGAGLDLEQNQGSCDQECPQWFVRSNDLTIG